LNLNFNFNFNEDMKEIAIQIIDIFCIRDEKYSAVVINYHVLPNHSKQLFQRMFNNTVYAEMETVDCKKFKRVFAGKHKFPHGVLSPRNKNKC
jgi:hypothetical protein